MPSLATGGLRGGLPKELYVVPKAGHVDLYDKTDLIPFDKLEAFFTENLTYELEGVLTENLA